MNHLIDICEKCNKKLSELDSKIYVPSVGMRRMNLDDGRQSLYLCVCLNEKCKDYRIVKTQIETNE